MRNSERVIGRESVSGDVGWRDDFLGHDFGKTLLGPHVNVWGPDWEGVHLFYPGGG